MKRLTVIAGRPAVEDVPDYTGPERRREELLNIARAWDVFGFIALLFFLFVVFSLS